MAKSPSPFPLREKPYPPCARGMLYKSAPRVASLGRERATSRSRDHPKSPGKWETVAAFPGGFGSVHAITLGIEPFAELGANSSSLSGSEVDSSCSRRTILGLAPVTVLQSRKWPEIPGAGGG